MFGDTCYRETTFACEICEYPLYQVVPSRLVTCLNPACDAEPLFIVGES